MMLQPFSNFEGWPEGSKERADAFGRACGWTRIMRAVGTDMLQDGSSDSAKNKISFPVEDVAADLRELADMFLISKTSLEVGGMFFTWWALLLFKSANLKQSLWIYSNILHHVSADNNQSQNLDRVHFGYSVRISTVRRSSPRFVNL